MTMALPILAGNEKIKQIVFQNGTNRGFTHAYLLSGGAGSGKHTAARLIAAAMLCTGVGRKPCGDCPACRKVAAGIHPDAVILSGEKENKPITVEQVRKLRADAYIRPNEGERKVYILEHADWMNPSAQNAMLKLLEDGPGYAAFLLLAENTGGVLPTILSRCEQLPLAPVAPDVCADYLRARFPEKAEEEIRQAVRTCQGVLGRGVEALAGTGETVQARRALAGKLCDALERASESQLFEETLILDKQSREELPRLLDELESQLGSRAAHGNRQRLLRAAELVRLLRQSAQVNATAQLSGWLCAGMFSEK